MMFYSQELCSIKQSEIVTIHGHWTLLQNAMNLRAIMKLGVVMVVMEEIIIRLQHRRRKGLQQLKGPQRPNDLQRLKDPQRPKGLQ